MKLKDQKGYTGIDIAISVVVLFIFVSLISFLSYQFNSTTQEIKRKAEAIQIAVEEVERVKNGLAFSEIESLNNDEYKTLEIKTGFWETILVEDYANLKPDKTSGLVKKIKIQIQYKEKNQIQTIELSTILAKES